MLERPPYSPDQKEKVGIKFGMNLTQMSLETCNENHENYTNRLLDDKKSKGLMMRYYRRNYNSRCCII